MILKRLGAFFLDILEVVFLAVGIFLFVYLAILQPHKIKGASMEPNFPDGEYLLTEKVSYRFNEPERGDVIVFSAPIAEGEEFIKRIIGLPGDTVSLKDSHIFVNGKEISETYLDKNLQTLGGSFLADGASVSVPPNQFFVLGDNRPHSSDSRAWGFVPKGKIRGKAWFVYWPIKRAGSVPKVHLLS